MSFTMLVNIFTSILCAGVLVQSVRMMRSLRALRGGAIGEVVTALDHSTQQARLVLSQLKLALGDCARSAQIATEGKAICDELLVMIGIADASADRLAEAANAAGPRPADAADADADAVMGYA